VRSFVIPVRDVDVAGRDFEFPVGRSWLEDALSGLDLRWVSGGTVRVRASMCGRDALVRGRVEVQLSGACARCLEPAPVRIKGTIERLYAAPVEALPPTKKKKKRPRRGAEEEVAERLDPELEVPDDTDSYDGETVVLDDAVREQILLEVPMSPLCRVDCPGVLPRTTPSAATGPLRALSNIVLPKKE